MNDGNIWRKLTPDQKAKVDEISRNYIHFLRVSKTEFRMRSIYVNKNSGIMDAKGIIGKKVGIPEFRQTAGVWIRGILNDYYQVPYHSQEYYRGPLEFNTTKNKFFSNLSSTDRITINKDIKISKIEENSSLTSLLERGKIDALYSAVTPSTLNDKNSNIRRLYSDFEEDLKYFKKTNIFPIMHVLIMKNALYEKNKTFVKSLYEAFDESMSIAKEEMFNATGALVNMDPFLELTTIKIREILGSDIWDYGIKHNLNTIKVFSRYCFEQGLTDHLLSVEELFPPELLDT